MAAFAYIRILWFLFLVFRFRSILGHNSIGNSDLRCERIAQFNRGDVVYPGGRKINSKALYRCDDAHSLFPTHIHYSICTDALRWIPEPPKCMKKAQVKVPDNGIVCGGSRDIIRHTESYSVCCNRGYELYSDHFLDRKYVQIKNRNGTLTPEVPRCIEGRCSFNVSSNTCYWMYGKEKCFPENFKISSQSSVNLTCRDGYKLLRSEEIHNVDVTEVASIICNKGVYSPVYECIPEKCSMPVVKHARLLSRRASLYENDEKISFRCDKGFHFYQNISTKVDAFETTCNHGNWMNNIPNECNPDGCRLEYSEGYRYSAGNAMVSATELMEHRTAVDLQCLEMFDLFDENGNIFLDRGYTPTITCYQGMWQNRHFCRKRCVVHNVTNGRLTKDRNIVKGGDIVVHGETVSVVCDNVFYDSVLSMECLNGEWQNLVNCIDESSSQTSMISTTETTKTTFIGCKLPDDSRYTYTDSNNDFWKKDPGSFISKGTILTVSCSATDRYDYDTDFYKNYTTVTCIDNELSEFELDCPEANCVVPNNIDQGLSMMNKKHESMWRDVIQSGTFVHFNCFKKCSSGYEPSNRRFQCINGRWTEAENDKSWQLGNNGEFPKCREALCTPDCVNGGICFKDNKCMCPPFTEGHQCEKFVCDDKCSRNGGTCVGPRNCSCPIGQSGLNCEHRDVWPLIIGGSDANISEYPYQVSLQDNRGRHICGASIVSDQWVLTAAHCVPSGRPSSVRISLNDGTLHGSSVTYRVAQIVKHDRYNKGNGAIPNDIALLQLRTPMHFRTYGHKPIRLASKYQNFANSKCKISGWGRTEGGNSGSRSKTLQATSGTILTHDKCKDIWRTKYNGDVHICIHEKSSGSCKGDSGGPMVCDGVLAGVSSFGAPQCRTSKPSVYARVSRYREWIEGYIS